MSNVLLRLYDKVLEARQDGDLKYWLDRWGRAPGAGESIVRVEWQLRRRFLESFRVTTIDTLLPVLGDVMRYLLDWARLAGPAAGKDHRRPDLPFWSWLRGTVTDLGLEQQGAVRARPLRTPDVRKILDLAVGNIISLVCAVGLERGAEGPAALNEGVAMVGAALQEPAVAERGRKRWQEAYTAALAPTRSKRR